LCSAFLLAKGKGGPEKGRPPSHHTLLPPLHCDFPPKKKKRGSRGGEKRNPLVMPCSRELGRKEKKREKTFAGKEKKKRKRKRKNLRVTNRKNSCELSPTRAAVAAIVPRWEGKEKKGHGGRGGEEKKKTGVPRLYTHLFENLFPLSRPIRKKRETSRKKKKGDAPGHLRLANVGTSPETARKGGKKKKNTKGGGEKRELFSGRSSNSEQFVIRLGRGGRKRNEKKKKRRGKLGFRQRRNFFIVRRLPSPHAQGRKRKVEKQKKKKGRKERKRRAHRLPS